MQTTGETVDSSSTCSLVESVSQGSSWKNIVFHSVRASVPWSSGFRDHFHPDSAARRSSVLRVFGLVMKLSADPSACSPPEDPSACSQPPWCGVATSSRSTIAGFRAQSQLVPHFCDIRIVRAVLPHFLCGNSSFRSDVSRECRNSFFSIRNFPSCGCVLLPQGWAVDVSHLSWSLA